MALRASARRLSRLVSGRCAGSTGRGLSGGPTPSTSGGGAGGGPVKPAKGAADPAAPSVNKNPAAGAAEPANPLAVSMFPWERAVLSDGRQDGPMKPWQKLYWAAFGAAVLFLAGNRARVYYQSVKSKEELEADLRENRRAMQAALEGKSFADGDDPFEGMEPHEIEALLRQNAPDGDPYAGMAPDEINAYLAKQQEEQVGKHLSMPRNIPRPR